MKSKIGKVGLFIAALGIMSIVLSFFNYNIRLLAWIDMWGDTVGWVIKISMIVVGAVLFFVLGRENEEE
jgi:hypothetical protein